MLPLVTIVTIARNASRYIAQTAHSVITQSYPNIEYLLVDGASTDDTVAIFRRVTGSQGKVYSAPDNGIYDAMNHGASLAKGEYILFMHADDEFIENDAIECLYENLIKSNRKWVCAFYKTRNSRNEVIKEDVIKDFDFSDMLRADQIRHQTTLVPTAIVREFPFSSKYPYAMDYDHFLRVWSVYGPPYIVHRHISYFRWDGQNLSSHFEASIADEFRVKLDFRRSRSDHWGMICDTIIYILRRLKIILYYNIRYGANVRS